MPVPIITYHGVGDVASPLWTPTRVFEAHLQAFAAHGYRTMTVSDLLGRLRGGPPPPDNALVIAFDDGYESVYREAWPRLKACQFSATVFVVSDYCGGTNQWPGQSSSAPSTRLLTWGEIETLAGEGWEFGAHTRTHPCLTRLPAGAVEDEVARSQDALRRRTRQEVSVFAYPYGETNLEVSQVVRRYFAGAAATRLGLVEPTSDPYFLPRIDACYLRPEHIPYLRGWVYRRYLSAREVGRGVRRRFRHDWAADASAPSGIATS